MFGSSVCAGTAPSNTEEQLDSFSGITSAKDSSDLKPGPATKPWNSKSSGSVNVLMESDASGHYFDNVLIPGQ